MAEHEIQEQAGLERLKKSPLGTSIVFRDDPLFDHSEYDQTHDAFNHEAFANTILGICEKNSPPLSIGLFGAWGIGKSTIINILFGKINKNKDSSLKPIYFNAWKYSGDSFRRQFLIEIAGQIYENESDRKHVTRLEQLNYTDVLKQSHNRSLTSAALQGLKDAFKVRFAFRGSTVWKFLIGCGTLIVGSITAAIISNSHQWIGVLLLTTVVPAIFIWFSQIKFEELFIFQEMPIYDPKLIFPEQFEKEFAALITSDALKGKKPVIAIDDLDRCEPKVVQDILISMKNFIGQANCFFIVPCDDQTIVQVFSDVNQKQGYKDEALRKYFNVGLRIPPITSTDLVDFANTTVRTTGIPEDIVHVAVLANCRDARKMKHFLNSFVMKYQIAKARESAGLMPHIVDRSLPELAKAVLIEDAYPDLFAKIVETPRIYHLLETAALQHDDVGVDLKSLNLTDWNTDFPGLKEILERTRNIRMDHADVFFSLKTTNAELKVPGGTDLKRAVIEGDIGLIDEIVKGITDGPTGTAAADLLLDQMSRSTGLFLQRSIEATLRICCGAKVFGPSDNRRVASAIIEALLYRDTEGILTQRPDYVLTCAEEVASHLGNVLKKYHSSVADLALPYPPDYTLTLISALYRFEGYRKEFATLFNEKFEMWIVSTSGLSTLESVNIPSDLPLDQQIPSADVVSKIMDGVSPDISELSNNVIRRTILFKHWKDEYAESFIPPLVTLLQGAQSIVDTDYGPDAKFAIESVILNHRLAESPNAAQLWTLIPSLFSRTTNSEGKIETSKAAIVFALVSKQPHVLAASREFLLKVWAHLSDPFLRDSLNYIKSIEDVDSSELVEAAVSQELKSINNELSDPSDRTAERVALCFDFSEYLPPDSLEDVFIRALDVNDDEYLERWVEIINVHQEKLDSNFPSKLANECLNLVSSYASHPRRQEILLRIFGETLKKLSEERKRDLASQYFDLFKDTNLNTRNSAAMALGQVRASLSNEAFRISLANTLGDLRKDVRTQELIQHRTVFEALIAQSELFNEYQWRDVADLSKRALSQPDQSIQDFGMSLVEKMPAIPEADQNEILDLLINIENSIEIFKERAAAKLDQLSAGNLSDSAKKILEKRNPTI